MTSCVITSTIHGKKIRSPRLYPRSPAFNVHALGQVLATAWPVLFGCDPPASFGAGTSQWQFNSVLNDWYWARSIRWEHSLTIVILYIKPFGWRACMKPEPRGVAFGLLIAGFALAVVLAIAQVRPADLEAPGLKFVSPELLENRQRRINFSIPSRNRRPPLCLSGHRMLHFSTTGKACGNPYR